MTCGPVPLSKALGKIKNETLIEIACIRILESNLRQVNITKTYVEDVMNELIDSSTINN